jgi:hypothetical protein
VNGVLVGSGAIGLDFNSVRAELSFGHVAGCPGSALVMDDIQIRSVNVGASEAADLGTLPPPPANLVVTSTTSVSINLAWDPVPRASRYIISRGNVRGTETPFTHTPANPTTFESDHLAPGSEHTYTVSSVVGRLFSNPSNEVFAAADPAPGTPRDVTATVIDVDQIEVSWLPGGRAVKYLVFQSINGGPFTDAGTTATEVFTATHLAPATTYTFVVQAEDAVQTQSPLSDPASATTP